jgi:hypothetical protein
MMKSAKQTTTACMLAVAVAGQCSAPSPTSVSIKLSAARGAD